jgi:hypothetical protein
MELVYMILAVLLVALAFYSGMKVGMKLGAKGITEVKEVTPSVKVKPSKKVKLTEEEQEAQDKLNQGIQNILNYTE